MAVIENLSLANTFGEWVNITNDVVDSVNTLYESDFTKTAGTLFLNNPTTGLSVSNNSLFGGLVQIGTTGSIVSFGLIEGKDSLVLSNTTPNKVVLTANGIVDLIGPNASLRVSNNAIIYGRLNVDNIFANTITVGAFNSNTLNAAFDQANSAASFANGAFVTGNSAASFANGAFLTSNNAFNVANAAFAQANNTFNVTNVAFGQANSAASFANGAFGQANTTNDLAYIVYAYANTGYTQANNAASFANGAFGQANSSASFANGAFGQANSAASFANGAFTKANTTNDLTYIVYAYANTGYAQANSAASFANGAFAKANLAFPSAGGTLTGDISGANATFQNITASGNFTISGITVYNSDTFTLNSEQITNANGTFSTHRPQAVGGVTANAAIRWNDSATSRSWQIRDVLNADTSTAYANIVTSNLVSSTTQTGIVQLNDTVVSSSTTTAATARVVKVAYDQANSAYAFANTLASTSGSFDRANSAYAQANSAASFANGAFTHANSAASFANAAFGQANSAASFANGAFTRANTKFNSSGGTISGDVTITGDLTVSGNATYIYTKTVSVNDSLIHLANNNTSSDVVDIGFYGTYNTGGFNRYTGLFRKAADKYYLVQALTTDPSQNTVTFSSLNRSTLDANFTGGTVSGLSAAIAVVDGGTGTTTSTGTGSVVLHTGPELISPSMSGMPTAPTASAGNNSTMVATTAFVNTAVTFAATTANSAASFANGAFARANSGYDQANSAASFANGAFARANSGYDQANSAASFANGAFARANSAYNQANSAASFANSAYAFANTGYTQANNASSFANGSFGQANSAASFANGAFSAANSAASFANGAFARANSAYNRSNSSIFSITANTNGALFANGTQGVAQTGNVLISLANTAVTSGTYGGTTQIPVYTVDGSGRIVYSANVTFTGGGATITNDTLTESTRYPLFANTTSGTLSTVFTSSANYTYNPSTGTLSAVIFTSLSDRSVKDNIQVVPNALDTIKQLEGVSFNWKQNGNKSYGVIAQDIEQVLPDVVQTNDEGLKTVDYQALSAFLIESIKQLSSEIEELKKQK
jgi:hypothetical protein